MRKDRKAGSNPNQGFEAEHDGELDGAREDEEEAFYEDELDEGEEYEEEDLEEYEDEASGEQAYEDEDEAYEDDEPSGEQAYEDEEYEDEDEEFDEYDEDQYDEDEYEDDEYEEEYEEQEEAPKQPSRFDRIRERLQQPTAAKPSGATKRPSPTKRPSQTKPSRQAKQPSPTKASAAAKQSTAGAPKSDIAVKWSIDRLNERERLFSFGGAALAAIFGVVIYFSETSNPHFRLAKNQLTPQTTLVIGLGAGVLLAGATFIGRRAPVGFVALFTGAGFSGSTFVLAIPFWALAFWLLFRSYKLQREAAATARAEARAHPRSASTKAAGGRGSGSRKAKAATNTGPKRPEANKRYTPPRPPPKPKPAPPARRSRKSPTKKD
ncbi:MAG TPA: hypothetical protein VIX85_10500 [Acidimicrobiales bacterium]